MLHVTWVILCHGLSQQDVHNVQIVLTMWHTHDSHRTHIRVSKIWSETTITFAFWQIKIWTCATHINVILSFGADADFVRPTIRAQCCNQDVQKPKCDFDWLHVLSHVAFVEHNLWQPTTCKSTWVRSILRYILLLCDFNFKLLSSPLNLSWTRCAITEGMASI